ncbi:MAG: IPTL-CTERM sorting domain-containing protein [Thermodesulfobacteriota bacterium]
MVKQSIRFFTYSWIISAALLAMIGWSSSASAGVAIPVVWDEFAVTEGNLARSTVNLLNVSGPGLEIVDLSGPDFAAAPLSSNTVVVEYDVLSDWTATFDPPVENLLLYIIFWRGIAGGPDPVTYQFDQSFTVLSGLGGTTVSNGNTLLSIPGSFFANGILQFSGPVSSLSVLTNGNNNSSQVLTFGVFSSDIPPTNIPTLSEWGLMAMAAVLGIAGFMAVRRRKVTA